VTTPPSPAPRPGGPATAAAVAEQLSWSAEDQQDAAKLEPLEPTVAAANAVVRAYATTTDPDRLARGAVQLAARLWRRRNSPEGVATLGADGAVYVQRTDPDIAMLLGMGSMYAPPAVG
jgi:hypothetical protein